MLPEVRQDIQAQMVGATPATNNAPANNAAAVFPFTISSAIDLFLSRRQ
jgi:hypothetical protein